jgi:hypothetical protein
VGAALHQGGSLHLVFVSGVEYVRRRVRPASLPPGVVAARSRGRLDSDPATGDQLEDEHDCGNDEQ